MPALEFPHTRAVPADLPVDTFPYHVVFETFVDRIEVLAIAHDRRRPGYWAP